MHENEEFKKIIAECRDAEIEDNLKMYIINANKVNDYVKAIYKLTDDNSAVQAIVSNLVEVLPIAKKHEHFLLENGYEIGTLMGLLKK